MLYERVASEGTAVSESRSRAGVWQSGGGGRGLAEQVDELEDVQSYDANSPAIARSQFSIAVSCEGVQPAASGHRTLSAGGESVESVADPEGENSSMPAKFPSRSILSIARREVSPAPQAPGSPEAHRANSVISKAYMQDISVRCGTPASVYAQGAVVPTPHTRASSLQNSGPQSSSGSEAGHPGKRKRTGWHVERLEGQASVPLSFARAPADAQWPCEIPPSRKLRGEQSVNAMWRGDSHECLDGKGSVAGPNGLGGWKGFAGTAHAQTSTPGLHGDETHPGPLTDFARTAVSRALNGRIARPVGMSTPCNIPPLNLPPLLPSQSIRGQPHAGAPNATGQLQANGRRSPCAEGSSPQETLYVGESVPHPLKQESEVHVQPSTLGLLVRPQAHEQVRSWSSSKDAQQALRDCLSTDTTASQRNLADGPLTDARTVTDSHIPEQEVPSVRRLLAQELQRRDSVIARIEGSHMDRTELALQSLLQDSHPPGAASWQDSALQDEPGQGAGENTIGSKNQVESELGQNEREDGHADSLSNAWPARAQLMNGAEPAMEPGLVAQSVRGPPPPTQLGPQPALTIVAPQGLAGPKTKADDGAEYPANRIHGAPELAEEARKPERSQFNPGPARSTYTGRRGCSPEDPDISHASNM